MTVYEVALQVTVVGSGGEDAEDTEDDASNEDEDDDEDQHYVFLETRAGRDAGLSARGRDRSPRGRASEVAFAIGDARSDAASIAVAFQSREGEGGAMFPAEAVIAWLAFDDDDDESAPGTVGHATR